MKKHKLVLDHQRVINNGLFASVKGAIFELEPVLAEMAKQIDENVSVSVEIKVVGLSKRAEEILDDVNHDEGDNLPEVDLKLQDDVSDPFKDAMNG